MFIKNFQHPEITIEEFVSIPSASWCFLGDNFSGIDRFIDILSGRLQPENIENLLLPENIGVLSFAEQQKVFEDELRNDDTDFLDCPDPGTLVREFVPDWQKHKPLFEVFKLDRCLDVGYRQLSSGQCRKLHLLRELTKGAQTIIIQNPFEGLDLESTIELARILKQVSGQGVELLLLVSSLADIPDWCSHLGLFVAGRLVQSGTRKILLPVLQRHVAERQKASEPMPSALLARNDALPESELVRLNKGFAAYGDKILFADLDLLIRAGDHTLVSGPNGCGKSTLLDIITGDNQKCYTNNLWLFGKKRGTGESIWDIKKKMGIVSPALHRDYRAAGTLLHVILSGLHDSIGLYQRVHTPEIKTARQWLKWVKLDHKAKLSFHSLSYAEQRLILICRALVKKPELLILDEPGQGLDDYHRNTLLDLLEKVAELKLSTILFVSHRHDEWRSFFRQHIRLEAYGPQNATS